MLEILLSLILALSGGNLCDVGTAMPTNELRSLADNNPQANAVMAVRGEFELFFYRIEDYGDVILYFEHFDVDGEAMRQLQCARVLTRNEGTEA